MESLAPNIWWRSRRSLFNRVLLTSAPLYFFHYSLYGGYLSLAYHVWK